MRRLLGAACVVCTLVGPGHGQDAPAAAVVPAPALRALGRVVTELGKLGRTADAEACADLLVQLGETASTVTTLRKQAAKAAASVKPDRATTAAVKALDGALSALDTHLHTLSGEPQAALARVMLQLDAEHVGAHDALGHVLRNGRRLATEDAKRADRLDAIEEAMSRAGRLEVAITREPGSHPVLEALGDTPIWSYRADQVRIVTAAPEPKVRRMLTEAMRLRAVVTWVLTGELAVPPGNWPVVLCQNRAAYLRSLEIGTRLRLLTPEQARSSQGALNWISPGGESIAHAGTEFEFESAILSLIQSGHVDGWAEQPAITFGVENWAAMRYLGRALGPRTGFDPKADPASAARETRAREVADRPESRRLRVLGRAGIAGCRAWMAHLARHDLDPPWADAMVDDQAKLGENARLKVTLMVDWLLECGPVSWLVDATRAARADKQTRVRAFEHAMGKPLTLIDDEWRCWLLREEGRRGLRQRLAGGDVALPADARECARYLEELRRASMPNVHPDNWVTLEIEPSLNDGCARHAQYLAKHPDLAKEWPCMHEEYRDREGFCPEGARAAAGVIVSGVTGPREAIDAWMGTVYHRWPLLDAGLFRVGWGLQEGHAVLDTASIVGDAPEIDTRALWPPPGRTKVPTRFAPEVPNPVPGQDQATWGYPVTCQVFPGDLGVTPTVTRMELRTVPTTGSPLDCWFIRPEAPYNLELAPAHRYGLIPKAPLRAATRYQVRVEFDQGEPLVWEFQTG